ncbi:Uncharacterised protein [Vibrio cholerae]|nr:Uncharacterised protein [Vibrio cholerae]
MPFTKHQLIQNATLQDKPNHDRYCHQREEMLIPTDACDTAH